MAQVRPIEITDGSFLWGHYKRLAEDRGRTREGILYSPVAEPWKTSEHSFCESFIESYTDEMKAEATEINWKRIWVVADQDGIYGELTLKHRLPLESCLHRAILMMGLEAHYRNRGFGGQLLESALKWARTQPHLEWVDLYFFEGNEPARALYRKFGFEEAGRTPDLFRVHGKQITDVAMTLRLT